MAGTGVMARPGPCDQGHRTLAAHSTRGSATYQKRLMHCNMIDRMFYLPSTNRKTALARRSLRNFQFRSSASIKRPREQRPSSASCASRTNLTRRGRWRRVAGRREGVFREPPRRSLLRSRRRSMYSKHCLPDTRNRSDTRHRERSPRRGEKQYNCLGGGLGCDGTVSLNDRIEGCQLETHCISSRNHRA